MKSLTIFNTNNNISTYNTNLNTANANTDTQIANMYLTPNFLSEFVTYPKNIDESQDLVITATNLVEHFASETQTVPEILSSADIIFDVTLLSTPSILASVISISGMVIGGCSPAFEPIFKPLITPITSSDTLFKLLGTPI